MGSLHRRLIHLNEMTVPGGYHINARGHLARNAVGVRTSYTTTASFNLWGRNSSGVYEETKSLVTREVTIELKDGEELTAERIQDAAAAFASNSLEGEYEGLTFTLKGVGVDGVEIDLDDPVQLTQIPLRGNAFRYMSHENGTGRGECVIDCILKGLSSNTHHLAQRHLNRAAVIDAFKSLYPEWRVCDGITLEQLEQWVMRTYPGQLSLYAVDPMNNVIVKHVASDAHHSLCIRVNGDHAYLITDKSVKHTLSHVDAERVAGKLQVHVVDVRGGDLDNSRVVRMDAMMTYEDIVTMLCEHPTDDMRDYMGLPPLENNPNDDLPANTIVLPIDDGEEVDVRVIVSGICNEYKVYIEHIAFNGNLITGFINPVTNKRVLFPSDFDMVKSIAGVLSDQLPGYIEASDCNSLSLLSRVYYDSMIGTIPNSDLSPALAGLFVNTKGGGLSRTFETASQEMNVGVDINKCYSAVLAENNEPYSIYNLEDDLTAFDPSVYIASDLDTSARLLPTGFYVIPDPITCPFYPAPFNRFFYPSAFVRFFVKRGWLHLSAITHYARPGRMLPSDTFRDATTQLYSRMAASGNPSGSKWAKNIVNRFTGLLGRTMHSKTTGCITESKQIAVSMHGRIWKNENDQLDSLSQAPRVSTTCVDGLYYVRRTVHTAMRSSHVPIYQHIIWQGVRRGVLLCETVVSAGLRVLAFKIDRVSVSPDTPHPHPDDVPCNVCSLLSDNDGLGTYKLETGRDLVRTPDTYVGTVDLDATRAYIESIGVTWIDEQADVIGTEDDMWASGLYCGGPGHGKSYALAHSHYERYPSDVKVQVLTMTAVAKNQLRRDKGIMCAQTFDHFITRLKHIPGMPFYKLLATSDVILIDECYRVSSYILRTLMRAKECNPKLVIKMYGDSNQTRPIVSKGNNQYNYDKVDAFASLCDYRRVSLPYRSDCARYDQKLYDVVSHLLTDGILSLPAYTGPSTKRHIVFTNDDKRRVDRDMMGAHVRENGALVTYKISGKKEKWQQDIIASVGLPVIARQNSDAKQKICAVKPLTHMMTELMKDKRVDNGERLYIVDATDDLVTLGYVECREVNVTMTPAVFTSNYDIDFAVTAFRVQGATIREPYTIHMPAYYKPALEQVYVAISRGISYEDVRLSYNGGRLMMFEPTPYNITTYPFTPSTSLSMIYRVRLGDFVSIEQIEIPDDETPETYIAYVNRGITVGDIGSVELKKRIGEHRPGDALTTDIIRTGVYMRGALISDWIYHRKKLTPFDEETVRKRKEARKEEEQARPPPPSNRLDGMPLLKEGDKYYDLYMGPGRGKKRKRVRITKCGKRNLDDNERGLVTGKRIKLKFDEHVDHYYHAESFAPDDIDTFASKLLTGVGLPLN